MISEIFQYIHKVWYRYYNIINICIFLCLIISSLCLYKRETLDIDINAETPIGTIVAEAPVEFGFYASQDNLAGIMLKFATYKNENLYGELNVKIVMNEETLINRQLDISQLNDNSFVEFKFPVQKYSKGKELQVYINAPVSRGVNAVTLWAEKGIRNGTETRRSGELLENTLVYKELIAKGIHPVTGLLALCFIINVVLNKIIKCSDYQMSRVEKFINYKSTRIAVYLVLGILMIIKMNFYSSYVARFPDENAHVAYIAYLEETNNIIPVFEDRHLLNLTNSVFVETKFSSDINYLQHSPLYYHIMRIGDNVKMLDNGNIHINLLFLRWFSQVFSLIGTLIYFLLGYKYIKSLGNTIIFAAITTLVPMYAYNAAGVTNDALALFGVPLLFYGMLRFEEDDNSILTFMIIAIGVFITALTKLTCGMIIAVSGIIYIYILIKNKKIKRLFCKEFIVTLPIYLLLFSYYIYIVIKYKSLQPSLSIIAPEYFKSTDFYVEPINRSVMKFNEYARVYWNGFLDTWISIRSHVSLSKGGEVWKLSGIGTFSIIITSIAGMITYFCKGKKDSYSIIRVSTMIFIGVIVAVIYQFHHSYMNFLSTGRVGAYQSRYYLCCIGIMGFLTCYLFEKIHLYIQKKVCDTSQMLFIEVLQVILSVLYLVLLMYNDIIYFLLNFVQYI